MPAVMTKRSRESTGDLFSSVSNEKPSHTHNALEAALFSLSGAGKSLEKKLKGVPKGGAVDQETLNQIRLLGELSKAASDQCSALKDLLLTHKKKGGSFAPGKVIVNITSYVEKRVPWRELWAKVAEKLAKAEGKKFNADKREEKIKDEMEGKTVTRVQLTMGD